MVAFPTRYVLVGVTFTLSMLLYIDRIAISTARAPVSEAFALTDTQFGWVLSAFALGYALFQTPSGLLVDRLGPRRVLTTIVVLPQGLCTWSVYEGSTLIPAQSR